MGFPPLETPGVLKKEYVEISAGSIKKEVEFPSYSRKTQVEFPWVLVFDFEIPTVLQNFQG